MVQILFCVRTVCRKWKSHGSTLSCLTLAVRLVGLGATMFAVEGATVILWLAVSHDCSTVSLVDYQSRVSAYFILFHLLRYAVTEWCFLCAMAAKLHTSL